MHTPSQAYEDRLKDALAQAEVLQGRVGRIGLMRFAGFIAAVLAGAGAFDGRGPHGVLASLCLLFIAAFVLLVIHHGSLYQRLLRARLRADVNRAGLRRLDGTWTEAPPPAGPEPAATPPYAGDLDLAGPASLTALMDTTQTRYGRAALWQALSLAGQPGAAAAARARQEAVRELGPLLDLRQALEVAGRAMHGDGPAQWTAEPDAEPLLRWAEGPPALSQLPLVGVLSRLPLLLLPVLALHLLILSWEGGPLAALAPLTRITGPLLLLLCAAHGLILLWTSPRIAQLLNRVASSEAALSAYGEMLTLLAEAPLTAPENQRLQALLRGDHDTSLTPERALHQLRGTYGMLELRQNPLAWIPLNLLFLWDLTFALRLERWQAEHGPRLRGWLLALGECEARASLAHLGHDNPDWAWPELVEPGDAPAPWVHAAALGHPLLPPRQRVGNDVALPGPGQALLVTGSNMSGKSTLLRALGLMQVLARAGAAVCARQARLPVMLLRTVVRVDDSLARGMSHFYAELQRLKEVVDAAGPGTGQGQGAPLLYLLDEILHGTNTRERELGARLTIRTLCARGALGVVTTHDLSLASLEQDTAGAVRNFHFTEIIEDGAMRFDYRLREGPVHSSNALRLMRDCGIALDWSLL